MQVFEDGVFEPGTYEGSEASMARLVDAILGAQFGSAPVLAIQFGSTLIWGEPPETDFTLTETGDGAILANLPPLIPFDAVDETGDGAILTMEP